MLTFGLGIAFSSRFGTAIPMSMALQRENPTGSLQKKTQRSRTRFSTSGAPDRQGCNCNSLHFFQVKWGCFKKMERIWKKHTCTLLQQSQIIHPYFLKFQDQDLNSA